MSDRTAPLWGLLSRLSARRAVAAPCNTCRLDEGDRLCVRCRRSPSEIARWPRMGHGERAAVLRAAAARPRPAAPAIPWAAPPGAPAPRREAWAADPATGEMWRIRTTA
ncbi:DUF1289 domain-containing protein [Jannaschia sp. Os4]|uniref:DUF1289 domain-containing protein n=1 Tax=Jannaschia sp. Os4 TaxID=2807617 RepID=UPI00193A55E2|nr:DUF1289 domain-containing protein [Jannaschia sp. Os4]MBM2574758.1 DUF1289 domain-containing protein [Jannaschia sp. Os4]